MSHNQAGLHRDNVYVKNIEKSMFLAQQTVQDMLSHGMILLKYHVGHGDHHPLEKENQAQSIKDHHHLTVMSVVMEQFLVVF